MSMLRREAPCFRGIYHLGIFNVTQRSGERLKGQTSPLAAGGCRSSQRVTPDHPLHLRGEGETAQMAREFLHARPPGLDPSEVPGKRELTRANSPLTSTPVHTQNTQHVPKREATALAAKPGTVIGASNSTSGKADAGRPEVWGESWAPSQMSPHQNKSLMQQKGQ
jgi:hypothetical protein